MDEYGKRLIEQGAREEREAIIKELEKLIGVQKTTGTYSISCPSVENAIDIIRSRNKKSDERAKIAEELVEGLRDWLEKNQGFSTDDHGTRMWRRGWRDAADWIERRRDE